MLLHLRRDFRSPNVKESFLYSLPQTFRAVVSAHALKLWRPRQWHTLPPCPCTTSEIDAFACKCSS